MIVLDVDHAPKALQPNTLRFCLRCQLDGREEHHYHTKLWRLYSHWQDDGFSISILLATNSPEETVPNPLKEGQRGFSAFLRGTRWLRKNPRYIFLLIIPTLIGIFSLTTGLTLIWEHEDTIFSWILFDKPAEGVLLTALWYVCKTFLYISFLVMSFVFMVLIVNIISCPIYEIVSVAVERDVTGRAVDMSLWESVKMIPEELKKVVCILLISIVLFLIPGLNLVATIGAAFLVGWDFYDYPMARRGWKFKQRMQFVSKDFISVTTFGLWMMIPFLQFFMMPLAVAGGTLLSLEALKKNNMLRPNAA